MIMAVPGQSENGAVAARPQGRVAIKEMAKDLHLRIGDRVLLSPGDSKDNIRAEVVGLYSNEFIIAHVPLTPGVKAMMTEGAGLVVRYIHAGKIFGFKSSVLRLIAKPKPLLFFEFPMMLEKYDLRKEERYGCSIPCIVQTKYERVEAAIGDLSRGGCRVTCDTTADKDCSRVENFKVGDIVVLMFSVVESEGVTLSGKIKNKSKDGTVYNFGISYTKLSSDMYERLDNIISKRLAGRPR
jgi:hypothetical protein